MMIELPNLIDGSNLKAGYFVFAYIDPGSGSILLQYAIAALIGGAIYFRKFILKIIKSSKKLLGLKPNDQKDN